MAPTDLPSSTVSVSAQATASGAGDGYIAVITPVTTLDDGVPRLYSRGSAAMTAHGYSPGISYAALHSEKTKRPFIVVPVPIATAGTLTAVSAAGAPTGTAIVTVAGTTADGPLSALDAILTVKTGGTVAAVGANIVLALSLDGGATTKTIRLGTATSYAVPDLNITLTFNTGVGTDTMIAGEYFTFQSTGPMWDSSGLTLARTGMAESTYKIRSWLVDGLLNATNAGLVGTAAAAYQSSNKRFILARAATEDLSEATWTLEAAQQLVDYSAVNSTDGRLCLGFGFRRITCPLTGWMFRRNVAWAASLREYEQGWDIHNATWRYDRGALTDWSVISTDVEHDERNDGGALAGRFTCFTSLDNDTGIYIAKDVSRASSDSVLFLPSNVHVTNAVCTIVQTETTRLLGSDLIKQADNTIDPNQAVSVEERVNSALKRGIMRQKVAGRGARASSVRATLARDDDLSGADATLTWVVELNLRGIVSKVTVQVRAF